MTRGQLRTMLRRQLQEVSEDQWTDDTLDSYLNMGLHSLQQAIMAVRPEAYLRIDDTDIVNASSDPTLALIPKPQGFHHEIRLQKQDSTSSSGWTDLGMISYTKTRGRVSSGQELKYAHWGRYFLLSPPPSTSVVGGLRLEWVPTLTMAEDTDVPDVPISLHKAIVYYAMKDALGETTEAAKIADGQLQVMLAQIPGFFIQSGADAEQIDVVGVARG